MHASCLIQPNGRKFSNNMLTVLVIELFKKLLNSLVYRVIIASLKPNSNMIRLLFIYTKNKTTVVN